MYKTMSNYYKSITDILEFATYVKYNGSMIKVISYDQSTDELFVLNEESMDEFTIDNASDTFENINTGKTEIFVLERIITS